jgi:hypothetical protein
LMKTSLLDPQRAASSASRSMAAEGTPTSYAALWMSQLRKLSRLVSHLLRSSPLNKFQRWPIRTLELSLR